MSSEENEHFESRLPRHRHSARALHRLGHEAVITAIELREQNASMKDASIVVEAMRNSGENVFISMEEEDRFLAESGLLVLSANNYFLSEKSYQNLHSAKILGAELFGYYDPGTETTVINKDIFKGTSLEDIGPKIAYIHERAHASGAWGAFPQVNGTGKVGFPSSRVGFRTISEQNGEKKVRGELLEEAFAYYVQAQYTKNRAFGFRNFPQDGVHTQDFQYLEIEDLQVIIFHPETDLIHAPLKNKVQVAKSVLEAQTPSVMIYPWCAAQGERPQDIALGRGNLLGMAFELIIEDDPSFFKSLVLARKDTQGLRDVRDKLNSLQPGLYKKLRDLTSSSEGVLEFYKLAVNALGAKLEHA